MCRPPWWQRMHGNAARRIPDVVWILGIAASLGVLLYLNVADLHAQWQAEGHISTMHELCRNGDGARRQACLEQARLYNAQLAGAKVSGTALPYRQQLLYGQEPMMSFIEIPRISVRLPIYHGVAENALMAGVGHWEASSLPVGGTGSHCVLMGHSGMRNTRMFDDLHKLAPGDKVVVWTLDDPYCYEVVELETLLPEQARKRLDIREGQDLLTLVTCTPQGVNSHRLLVHAKRCAYVPEEAGDVGLDAYVNDRNLPLLAAFGALAAHAGIQAARRGHAASARIGE